jgi:hypothetical protein
LTAQRRPLTWHRVEARAAWQPVEFTCAELPEFFAGVCPVAQPTCEDPSTKRAPVNDDRHQRKMQEQNNDEHRRYACYADAADKQRT